MKRICPKCKSVLGNYDHYFCSRCGSPLPPDLILKETRQEKKFFEHQDNGKSTFSFLVRINYKLIFTILGPIFFLGFVYFLYTKNLLFVSDLEQESPVIVEKSPIEIPGTVPSVDLLFSDYIPYQSSVYLQISSEDYKNDFFDYINEEFKTYYNSNKDLINEEIAFFGIKAGDEIVWNIVIETKGDPVSSGSLESFVDGNYSVLSMYEEIIKECKDSYNEISKNLSKSSKYVLAKSSIPDESENYVVVLNSDFRNTIDNILEKETVPEFYKNLLEDVKETQLDYAFIL